MTPQPLLAVAAVLLATATPAHADHHGGCGFEASPFMVRVADTTVGSKTEYHGAVYAAVATAAPATVRCYLTVNGTTTVASTAPVHGTGVIAVAEPLAFTAVPGDVLSMCTEVAYDGGGTETACGVDIPTQIPPQPVVDLIHEFDEVSDAVFDPMICPIWSGLTGEYDDPGVEEELVDVYPPGVAGEYRYDCPPYDS